MSTLRGVVVSLLVGGKVGGVARSLTWPVHRLVTVGQRAACVAPNVVGTACVVVAEGGICAPGRDYGEVGARADS
jgi:hypothetical protein